MTSIKDRPALKIGRTAAERIAEGIALVGLAAMIVVTAAHWPLLPERRPQHFDAAGRPDAWGSRGMLLSVPLVAVGLYVLLTVLSFFPRRFNYLWPITPENARDQYRLARQLVVHVKMVVVWIFGYITWGTIRTGMGRMAGLGAAFLPVSLILVFGLIVIYSVRSYRAR